ncbi:MAG: HD domain-containing protein, partial [Planctomycetales bacterium]|nr:HD domain-containing protein [Planctomycetales bacterium]
LAQRLVQDISDLGIELGFSVRTTGQCKQMIQRDPVILTSLLEARFLVGSVNLYRNYSDVIKRTLRRRTDHLIREIEESRKEERAKYGDTVHLLEPNVKRSRGGLRDIQLLRWVGGVKYGYVDPNFLQRSGFLSNDDYRTLRKAIEFLLRLRNELHFHADNARDILTRSEQKRIAEVRGYQGRDGLLGVEEFMQEYFEHSEAVRHVVSHFVSGARWHRGTAAEFLGRMTSRNVKGDFRIGPRHIVATRQGLLKVTTRALDVLRLIELASQTNRRIDHPTWEAIRNRMIQFDDIQVDEEAITLFKSMMARPEGLGRVLRRLHELRVLEKLIPGFSHARCLLQFNEYHRYTVDEHSIRAVERATDFSDDNSVLGKTYREIKNKSLLHLALLVHDLGKGFPEDHSEVGATIAEQVADNLTLNQADAELLRFLVHRHLMLSHLAFRRDTSDETLVISHAAEIGSPEVLRMLFVLTCADLAAVGPGVLNQWKLEVLTSLFQRLMHHVSGDEVTDSAVDWVSHLRTEVRKKVSSEPDREALERHIDQLPLAYLEGPSSEWIVDDLRKLNNIAPANVIAWGRYIPERQVAEYSVSANESNLPGVFHRLTGALTSMGLRILSAEIHSLADNMLLDRFDVQDDHYQNEPPKERFDAVSKALVQSLTDEAKPVFKKRWNAEPTSSNLTDLPTKVRIDNSTSDHYTIIDVFTHDRIGLLYTISETIFNLGLSVHHAKIGTYLDQVVDVFYVTDSQQQKIQDEDWLSHVKTTLLNAIDTKQAHSPPSA